MRKDWLTRRNLSEPHLSFSGDGGLTVRGSYEVQYANSGKSKKFRMPGRYYHFHVTLEGKSKPLAEFFALDTNSLTHNLADIMYEPLTNK